MAPNGGEVFGGAIYSMGNTAATFTNCLVSSNLITCVHSYNIQSASGGGIYIANGTNYIRNCVISDNRADGDWQCGVPKGGGVGLSGTAEITDSVIRNNDSQVSWWSPYGMGDGVHVGSGAVLLRNCLIAENHGDDVGIGLRLEGGTLRIENCTIAGSKDYGLWQQGGTMTVSNSIVWENGDDVYETVSGSIALYHSTIQDGDREGQDGCTQDDPRFVDTTYYHVRSPYGQYQGGYFSGGSWANGGVVSPAIDSCATNILPTRESYPNGGLVNRGAYGNSAVASKSHPLSITNLPASGIGTTFARLRGRFDHIGSANTIVRIYWGLTNGSNNPAAWQTNSYVGSFNRPQEFSRKITGLIEGSTYYYTCFASNSSETSVWCQPSLSFKAELKPPELINSGVLNEFGPSVTLKGTVTSTGGNDPTVYVCWGYQEGNLSSTASWQHVDIVGVRTGAFTKAITTVSKSNYFYTCFATNSAGSAWASPALPFGYYQVRYVATDAVGMDNGYNWANAYTTIHDALKNCKNAKTNLIYVKGQAITVYSQLHLTNSYVVLKGGYKGATNEIPPGTWDPVQWPTTITNQVGAFRLLRVNGCTNVTVDSLRLIGGNVSGWGGGVNVANARNVYFINCLFERNKALERGGGIFAQNVNTLRLLRCTIANNTLNRLGNTLYGGGIYLENSSGLISNSVIEMNSVYGAGSDYCRGGGIYVTGLNFTFRDLLIRYNRLTYVSSYQAGNGDHSCPIYSYGGGVYVDSGTHTLKNCVLANNNALGTYLRQGSGAYVNNGTLNMENCTVAANHWEGLRRAGGTVTARDSIFWRNTDDITGTVALTYCDIEDGTSKGVSGNISVNPRFERGLYLQPSSPAINTGSRTVAAAGLTTYTTLTNGTLDIGTVDMGYHSVSGLSDMAELYVDSANGDDEYSGKDWPNAFHSITKATQVAPEGARIHVAAGTYSVLEKFPITVGRYGLQLIGAGAGTTILDANRTNRVMTLYNNSFGRLEGMRLTDGWVSNRVDAGGGLYVGHSYNTTIKSCVISNNFCGIYGGGVDVEYSTGVMFDSCTISHNLVDIVPRDWIVMGGGMYLYNSSGAVSNCFVLNNTVRTTMHGWSVTRSYGGGIGISYGSWGVVRTVIKQNGTIGNPGDYLPSYGGGVFLGFTGTHTFKNCLIANNSVSSHTYWHPDPDAFNERGGGLCTGDDNGGWGLIGFSGVVNMMNCNVLYNAGEGVRRQYGTVNITNSILWANGDDIVPNGGTVGLSYCDIEDNDTGTGCMNVNPQFAELTHYHLKSRGGRYTGGYFSGGSWIKDATTSPLVDRGARSCDYSAELQPNGKRVNIGMYGGTEVAEKTFDPATVIWIL